jgi:RNA polymerase sigma-70 factor, ECF subfamily
MPLSRSRCHPGEITLLLSNIQDAESLGMVINFAYDELHSIAAHHSRQEPPGRTLSTTAVLNEGCVRLLEAGTVFKNRRHFFGAASKAMRRTLIDSARKRQALKRGRGWRRVDFSEAERIGFEQPRDLLDLNTALSQLEAVKPQWSEVVELRVFGGCSTGDMATILGVAPSTARRRWANASKWLRNTLANNSKSSGMGGAKMGATEVTQ